MAKKRGLGQGLNALIPEDLEGKIVKQNKSGVLELKIAEVEPNRNQPRKMFEEDSLQELADSISQYGVIQPIIVLKKLNYYEIVAGERRWRAAKLAKLKQIPAIIREFTPETVLEVSLIENIQRENINPIEEAIAYNRLIKEFGLKQDEIAEKVSKSRSAIANILRLLNLGEDVRQMIVDDMITSGHARALLSIADMNLQYEIANHIFDEKLSVRETEKLIKSHLKPVKEKKSKPIKEELDPVYKQIQEDVKEILGTKVTIIKKNNNIGKIEVEYYSKEELDRILELLRSINQ